MLLYHILEETGNRSTYYTQSLHTKRIGLLKGVGKKWEDTSSAAGGYDGLIHSSTVTRDSRGGEYGIWKDGHICGPAGLHSSDEQFVVVPCHIKRCCVFLPIEAGPS